MTDLAAKIAAYERRIREADAFEKPEEPPAKLHFTLEFDCTWDVWESVSLALRSFPLENRKARQGSIERIAR